MSGDELIRHSESRQQNTMIAAKEKWLWIEETQSGRSWKRR